MRFEGIFAHQEAGCGLRPRHPMVCILDVAGFVVTLGLLAVYPQKLVVVVLPLAMLMQYAISCAYHWLPHNGVWRRLDHLMIAVLITATYVPYWGTMLPAEQALPRFVVVGVILGCVCVAQFFFFKWQILGGILFLALGLYGNLVSLYELPGWLPPMGFIFFWAGMSLYLVQFAVYAARKPNPLPERFGYREVQHLILVAATTLQSIAVLKYL